MPDKTDLAEFILGLHAFFVSVYLTSLPIQVSVARSCVDIENSSAGNSVIFLGKRLQVQQREIFRAI